MALTYTPKVWNKIGESSVKYSYEEYGIKISSTDTITVTYAPLTLVINDGDNTETGTLSITKTGNPGIIYYSKDNGVTKEELSSNEIEVSQGEKVRLYRTLDKDLSSNDYFTINTSGCTFKAYGSVMSLIDGDNFSDSFEISYNYALYNLFANNSNITDFSGIVLQATELSNYCYYGMFNGCTGLTIAPELEAETLADGCYRGMFKDCTGLTTAPELPATALANNCYEEMFSGCTGLTTTPELPAETLANSCYQSMFSGCNKLTTAPELPATELAEMCYFSMFAYCGNLETSPVLPATTLAYFCYGDMFSGCNKLTIAPVLPATTLAEYCYFEMFHYCRMLTTAPALPATTLAKSCYSRMFYGCTSLETAPTLSATTLTESCYSSMFNGCRSLTTAPELPATTMKQGCYSGMFRECTNLITPPRLPATELAQGCYDTMFMDCNRLTTAPELPARKVYTYSYYSMFNGCTNLTEAPELPATELADLCYAGMFGVCFSLTKSPSILPATQLYWGCYMSMFSGCTGLTTAPTLPATTLAKNCYSSMFASCTNLITAPNLPATTLVDSCYSYMFYGCENLNKITCLAINISAYNCTEYWVEGVAPTGTFTKDASMTDWTTGVNGIPTGWIVANKGKVGGTIFYIDNTADGTYTFYDAQGNVTSAPIVGTDCTDWSYAVSGASKDKYYVYNPSAMFKRDRTGTQTDPFVAWTYLDTTNQSYIDNDAYTSGLPSGRTEWSYYGYRGRVFETLDGTYTGTAIGTGKSNTSNMLSLRRGIYNQGSQERFRGQTTYSETIWYICDLFNKGIYSLNGSPVPNNTGCNDWYIPSKDELETMKSAIGASTFASMLYSGAISYTSIRPWSSSAYSHVVNSWYWILNGGQDYGMHNDNRHQGNDAHCLALSRSF